ncbi:hypothetical protein WBJ53_32545 (plasmid) [Spirosoma sp. SC4-14]|uniref:hypothetical protein n=1 Tax=Spirosoma sp. SC4-14 TaxID=3128900 RepID=UPI0030D073A6
MWKLIFHPSKVLAIKNIFIFLSFPTIFKKNREKLFCGGLLLRCFGIETVSSEITALFGRKIHAVTAEVFC